ncbi:uncharacterized protein LOC128984217 [Macrosteles quadrilineatus]|uniref:uncharacterized protein LOC128984217 n=1 Tax=Macrosteles quadrilineatus TaxID=74068 RepID=UPI0023E2CC52|nr:uncharacterized protein LOC128984217 [Macrosteles quadrilineatus]
MGRDLLLRPRDRPYIKKSLSGLVIGQYWNGLLNIRIVVPPSRFLGHAGTYRSVAFSYRMGESTVANIVHSTCRVIWEKLSPVVMPKPDKNKWEKISETFNETWQYPNAIGAIDGKHVVIEKPGNSGSMFFNYKKGFSIVLLALVDANCNFITVDVGTYGKNSDGGIFKESQIGKSLHNGLLDLPPAKALGGSSIVLPHVMLADEAFPLHMNIMRPFPGPQLINNTENKVYNYRHSRGRRVVESGFGILAKKFRVYSQKLQVKPDHAEPNRERQSSTSPLVPRTYKLQEKRQPTIEALYERKLQFTSNYPEQGC